MNSFVYEQIVRPLLFRMDPETAHHFAIAQLARMSRFPSLLRFFSGSTTNDLSRTVFGLKFPNPIGLAAGMDKNAVALPAWEALGFGFVEAGTITAKAQPGNPKPRIFRVVEKAALINRLGFNNDGADEVALQLARLKRSGRWPSIPVGLNIGKSKITPIEEAAADYVYSFEKLFPFADYFVLNVSSPNTPGLRTLQNKAALDELFRVVQESNVRLGAKPLLVKIAPDLEFEQIEEIIELVHLHRLAGIVATNTTLDHSSVPAGSEEQGGLSGKPLRDKSTRIVKFVASKTALPIIAVGGIFDADSAREKFDAGASLIQLYTGFIYRGPPLIRDILRRGIAG